MSDRSQRAKKSRRSSVDSVPVAGLSMFDRVFLGMDEDSHRVEVSWSTGTCSSAVSPAAASRSR